MGINYGLNTLRFLAAFTRRQPHAAAFGVA
jgi:hypothetical protein